MTKFNYASWNISQYCRDGEKVSEEYILVERSPTPEEFRKLREAAGWENVDLKATEIALNNSLFSVCVMSGNEVIGCGRLIGDGGIYFYIQDIIVLPEFQGKGIGERILGAVLDHLRAHAHHNAFVGVTAAMGDSEFHERFGFTDSPVDGPGTFRRPGQ